MSRVPIYTGVQHNCCTAAQLLLLLQLGLPILHKRPRPTTATLKLYSHLLPRFDGAATKLIKHIKQHSE